MIGFSLGFSEFFIDAIQSLGWSNVNTSDFAEDHGISVRKILSGYSHKF